MSEKLKIYVLGVWVLMVAVLANIAASMFGVATWYDFIFQISKLGFVEAFLSLKFTSVLFLFFLYPALLGYCAHYLYKRIKI